MIDEHDSSAGEEASKQELFEQELKTCPVVEVLGVVAASGVSGGKSAGDEMWTLAFRIEPWRYDAGDLQTYQLIVRWQVEYEEYEGIDRFRELISPHSVVHIKARVVANPVSGLPYALLEDFIGIDTSDAELKAFAAELQKPVIHTDPVLGTFTLDRPVDWFSGHVEWCGNRISLNLSAIGASELEQALRTAHLLWNNQDSWNQRIRDYAVQALLRVKNDIWLDDDEDELTADQFKARMTLEAVTVYPDGSFEFWHNDGDLFAGHSILIRGNLSEGPTGTDIPG